MRLGLITGVLSLAILLVALMFFSRQRMASPANAVTLPKSSEAESPSSARKEVRITPPVNANEQKTTGGTATLTGPGAPAEPNSLPQQHKAYVESRTDELMDLAMTDDPASLDTILSELTNRDPDIRKAALQASIQFGSRD